MFSFEFNAKSLSDELSRRDARILSSFVSKLFAFLMFLLVNTLLLSYFLLAFDELTSVGFFEADVVLVEVLVDVLDDEDVEYLGFFLFDS